VLVIGAGRDRILNSLQTRALADSIPGASYKEIDSGHIAFLNGRTNSSRWLTNSYFESTIEIHLVRKDVSILGQRTASRRSISSLLSGFHGGISPVSRNRKLDFTCPVSAFARQVDAATLARLIYTSRQWRFWTVIANQGGGIAGEDEALAAWRIELTHEKSF
jgi:hypothetical protein